MCLYKYCCIQSSQRPLPYSTQILIPKLVSRDQLGRRPTTYEMISQACLPIPPARSAGKWGVVGGLAPHYTRLQWGGRGGGCATGGLFRQLKRHQYTSNDLRQSACHQPVSHQPASSSDSAKHGRCVQSHEHSGVAAVGAPAACARRRCQSRRAAAPLPAVWGGPLLPPARAR